MLSTVPQQMNLMARNVTLRHPNSMDCEVYRKVVTRTSDTETEGYPTLGGMTVLDSEDEAAIDWEEIGPAKLLNCEPFVSAQMVNRDDGIDQANAEMYVMVEFLTPAADPNAKVVDKHDVLVIEISTDVKIAYEVMEVDAVVNVPPFARRYRIEKRDLLLFAFDD
ncbi:hypothetical protein QYH69_07795 [Paraburkholderia sp. SARCC-3016]|uniref:hypothetical protein n=1 Tax=Paraburkholderia sp. SARCC-3016 TaxID=3058611 RepID=UPI00280808EA|nr:hypothetical protein [Paraburkholderia sp. SARCC-3016]MDQ7977148.1 hypothetical protein [Paraburkholderia sp. SARCC-3016]